jgi:hypothetical protein
MRKICLCLISKEGSLYFDSSTARGYIAEDIRWIRKLLKDLEARAPE